MRASSPTTLNRTNIVRIPYVKYLTGANKTTRTVYRALGKPNQTAARRAFLTGRAIGEWHAETKCLFCASALFRVPASLFCILFSDKPEKSMPLEARPCCAKRKWQNSQYKKALCRSREPFARYEIGRKESNRTSFCSCEQLQTSAYASGWGSHNVLSLDFSDNASLCTAALEPLESIFQGFAFLDANFRASFSLPPTQPARSRLLSGPLIGLIIIVSPPQIVKKFLQKPQKQLFPQRMMRLTSLFLT